VTDQGRHREANEDRFGVLPEVGVFLVADGMGGAAAGEVAASMAIELVGEAFTDAEMTWPLGVQTPVANGLPMLVAAVQRANHCIHQAAQLEQAHRGMGTTIVALVVRGQRAALAHAGDSRIYRLRGCRLELLTEDHSLFNELVRLGYATPDDSEKFPNRNLITRALGPAPNVEVEGRLVEIELGDTFLLCSDGLCGVVDHKEIADILVGIADLDEAAQQLVTRANELGGPDNITAVLIRVG
jgi:PPM family protein phosphatase